MRRHECLEEANAKTICQAQQHGSELDSSVYADSRYDETDGHVARWYRTILLPVTVSPPCGIYPAVQGPSDMRVKQPRQSSRNKSPSKVSPIRKAQKGGSHEYFRPDMMIFPGQMESSCSEQSGDFICPSKGTLIRCITACNVPLPRVKA